MLAPWTCFICSSSLLSVLGIFNSSYFWHDPLVGKKPEAGLRARQEQQARDLAEQQRPPAQEAARLEELLQGRDERLAVLAAVRETLTIVWYTLAHHDQDAVPPPPRSVQGLPYSHRGVV